VVKASDLSTYDILNAENLILAESSVKAIETILSK
jgi:ribosomal protein L4